MERDDAARKWKERAFVWALGVGVALLAWISGNSSIFPPELWEDVSVVIGVRPPPTAIPGLWTWLAAKLFAVAGLQHGLFLLRLLGPVSLGILAMLVFRMFAEIMPVTLARRMTRKGWSRRVVWIVLTQGTLLFVLSDPVWRAGRVFSPVMFKLMVSVVTLRLFFKALQTSQRAYAVAMAAVTGLLAADSPLGFLPMIAFPMIVISRTGSPDDPLLVPFANPLVRVVTFRRITLAFVFTWLLAMTLNMGFFNGHEGLDAHDLNAFTLFIQYINRYAQLVRGAATLVGWLFVVGVVLAPLSMAMVMVSKATDDDRFLPYLHGLLFAVVGTISFLQSAGWQPFWFWRWVKAPSPVGSDFFLCLCLLATALTATWSLCVLGVEIYFRNYRRIAMTRYQDAVEDGSAAAKQTVRSFRPIDRIVRTVLICEPILAAAMVVPFRFASLERNMGAAVNDFAALTAAECGDARCVFTDGALDAPVEVAAKLQGRSLKALSMMSGSDPYEIHLRTRGETDEEDSSMLATGAADALRTWVRDKPSCATNIALQLGFELWKHDKKPMPPFGGVVARTAGFGEEGAAAGIKAAHELSDRILALYEDDDPADVPNNWLKTAFMFVQWRLARMCRMRSDAADRVGDMTTALAETERADRLDKYNVAYDRLRRQMEWVAHQKGVRLTPREGLRVGLDRADFRLARTFAQQVLVSDPYDTRANFAMGMGYFTEELYGRAEYYLKRCLVRKPNEPAVLNNLAIVQLRLGHIEEAETNVTKALKIFPGSPEIKKTFDHISKAKSKKL